MHVFVRRVSAAILILAVVFIGINVMPASLPQGDAQQISVAGTILGLAVIAGVVYLISQDHQGVYHRYPYGQYYQGAYRYQGPYSSYYHNYQGRFYNGLLPSQWSGNQGTMNWHDYHRGWSSRCAPQADNHGRWGQGRQWDAWCQQNLRFRAGYPDEQWRRASPWDYGGSNDGPGK